MSFAMGSKRLVGFLFVMFVGFLSSSEAYKFFVGGRDGWVSKPSEKYSHWAERNRFQVNDTLFFKYEKGSDSVLVVTKEQYSTCNTSSPIQSMANGDSVFQFPHSGPFYFISGRRKNCEKGQKLIVVVLAVRDKTRHAPPPSPSPAPEPPVSPSPAADPPAPPPEAESPGGESPGSSSPEPRGRPSAFDAPAPAPSGKSAAPARTGSVGLALGVSIVVGVVLSSFVRMV